VQVALGSEFADQTGHFYHNGREMKAAEYAHDHAVQQKLWEVSAQLTGLSNL
jgi:hypothetical protein